MSLPKNYFQLTSTVTPDAELVLRLVEKKMPEPNADQVIVRVEASPVNPSDLAVLLSWADIQKASSTGADMSKILKAPISRKAMPSLSARLNKPLPAGNEGAGTVVAAGESEAAQKLLGKTVAAMDGALYGQYRCLKAAACLPLKSDQSARDGASAFVNPLTSLSMVENMKLDGHKALIHTAAASNLGQMLNRICLADGVNLINIVRREEQANLLRNIGAKHVINSSSEKFIPELADAIEATNATLAFDAIAGGQLASDILTAMEISCQKSSKSYSVYGSSTHKQIYLYGSLNNAPTSLSRSYGMSWGVGGWLLMNFMTRAGKDITNRMRQRVVKELNTTFESHYTDEISLSDLLNPETLQKVDSKRTGQKFLLSPQL